MLVELGTGVVVEKRKESCVARGDRFLLSKEKGVGLRQCREKFPFHKNARER